MISCRPAVRTFPKIVGDSSKLQVLEGDMKQTSYSGHKY